MYVKLGKDNTALTGEPFDKIELHKEKCLPHISLCMGCIDEDKIPEIKTIFDEVATEFSPFNLQAVKSSLIDHQINKVL